MTDSIQKLARRLGLPFNQNPSLQQIADAGIPVPKRPAAPKAPPPRLCPNCGCCDD